MVNLLEPCVQKLNENNDFEINETAQDSNESRFTEQPFQNARFYLPSQRSIQLTLPQSPTSFFRT